MHYLPEFLTVAVIHLLAVMSPGPDFVLISRNSVLHSRRTGVYSAIGLGLGIIVHVFYSLVGIGLLISQSIVLFSIVKYAGAGYLIYIGVMSLRAKKNSGEEVVEEAREDLTKRQAVRMGFFTNVLNPKVTLFFLALFTQVISPETPLAIQIIYGLEMLVVTVMWFTLVALALSHKHVKGRFVSVQHHLERVFGVVIVALGIKIATEKN